MKIHIRTYAWLWAIGLAASACGTKSDDSDNSPTPTHNQTTTQPTPSWSTDNAKVVLEDSETANQNDYRSADMYGVRYDAKQQIPFDNEYGSLGDPRYNPNSSNYYAAIQNYGQSISQPYSVYEADYQRPYLLERYNQHRQVINYSYNFNQVQVNQGHWNQQNYQHARQVFDRSQRWVNVDIYNLVDRTLRTLQSRNFRSHHGLEDRLRDCIRNRDHRGAARYHDDLLREARQPHSGRGGGHRR